MTLPHTIFRGGRVLLEGGEESILAVVVAAGRIAGLGATAARRARRAGAHRVDLGGALLAPGFVDIHTHGAVGVDFFRASREDLDGVIREHYPAHGVTSLLLSLYPAPRSEFRAALNRLADALDGGVGGGIAAGIHLEGPFLNPKKPGALPGRSFSPCDAAMARDLVRAGRGWVRTQTIAPELKGAHRLITLLRRENVVPFLGHTDAGFEEARGAFAAGIPAVTHLFNAMNGIHHRAPGPAAAALLDEKIAVELIADGFHLAPEVLRMVARLKDPSRICLVSDSVAPCGLAEGRYEFAGAPVHLVGGRVTLLDGTLAGSALTLDRAVRLMARAGGASRSAAVRMASATPAQVARLPRRGRIAPGARADLVVLDERLRVRATYVRGERVFSAR